MGSYIIAISGPTAAGKTYFTQKLLSIVKDEDLSTVKVSTDEFYHDLSHLTMQERSEVNYDLPDSIDQDAFNKAIEDLSSGVSTQVPVYDFTTHTRKDQIREIDPADLIIVEGIFSLSFPRINKLYDLKVFIDLDQDLRLIRRVRRDMEKRGRSLESIFKQYLTQVRPSQNDYVNQDKTEADMILFGNRDHSNVYQLLLDTMRFRTMYKS